MPPTDMLSPPDIAALYGIPANTTRWHCRKGKLSKPPHQATRLKSGHYIISADDAAWFATQMLGRFA